MYAYTRIVIATVDRIRWVREYCIGFKYRFNRRIKPVERLDLFVHGVDSYAYVYPNEDRDF